MALGELLLPTLPIITGLYRRERYRIVVRVSGVQVSLRVLSMKCSTQTHHVTVCMSGRCVVLLLDTQKCIYYGFEVMKLSEVSLYLAFPFHRMYLVN